MRPNNSPDLTTEDQFQDNDPFKDDIAKLKHQRESCRSPSNADISSASLSETTQDGDFSDTNRAYKDSESTAENLSKIQNEQNLEAIIEKQEKETSSHCEIEQFGSSIEVEEEPSECEGQTWKEENFSSLTESCFDGSPACDTFEDTLGELDAPFLGENRPDSDCSKECEAIPSAVGSIHDEDIPRESQLSGVIDNENNHERSCEGRTLLPFDYNHRRSNSLVGSTALLPTVDIEEEERRRQEVHHAMEALEHMRRANLVVEFGPNVDFGACVHCLRANRGRKNTNPLQKVLPRGALSQCLICQTPLCKKHWDPDFQKKRVVLCQECAPLFDLDILIDCMRNDKSNGIGNTKSKQVQHIRKLLNLYDRALLALRYSTQNFDDTAQEKLMQTYWNKEGLGLGSTVTNIASGITGLAATAVMLTPIGPSLLLTSLALGGIATAVGSGGFLLEKMCPETRQAEQTIALASMVDSLLEATSLLREARLTAPPNLSLLENGSTTPVLEDGNETKEHSEHHNSGGERPILFLEQDKEQQLMIASLKGALEPDKQQKILVEEVKERKARERRQRGPLGFFSLIRDGKKSRQERRHQRTDSDARFDELLEDVEEEEKQGTLRKAARCVGVSLNNTKDRAGEAAAVAKTAAALAAVGMSAGGSFGTSAQRSSKGGRSTAGTYEGSAAGQNMCGLELFLHNLFSVAPRKKDDDSHEKEELGSGEHVMGGSLVARCSLRGEGAYANEGFMNILVRSFAMASTNESSCEDVNTQERALVAKIRLKNTELMLKSSAQSMKELTRTGFRVAKHQVRSARASFINRHDVFPTSSDRMVVKHARLAVKATISVLREAARFAGGAFSAAIVCVETVELKNSVERIRTGNPCATAEQLQRLRRDIWSNQSSFPDTQTLECELFAEPSTEAAHEDTLDGQNKIVTPVLSVSDSYYLLTNNKTEA